MLDNRAWGYYEYARDAYAPGVFDGITFDAPCARPGIPLARARGATAALPATRGSGRGWLSSELQSLRIHHDDHRRLAAIACPDTQDPSTHRGCARACPDMTASRRQTLAHAFRSESSVADGRVSAPTHSPVTARVAAAFARTALGIAFLSAVADRFGLWGAPGAPGVAWGDFENFVRYTATVNAFLPPSLAPLLAWAATVAETALGFALLTGVRQRMVAAASALLLLTFAVAMAISLGVKKPIDFSVFSASAAAFLLAVHGPLPSRRPVAAASDLQRAQQPPAV